MKNVETTAPWWKHGHVWLLISGPAAVVVAGLLTAWIAFATADPVVGETRAQATHDRATLPALQARNHAASPNR